MHCAGGTNLFAVIFSKKEVSYDFEVLHGVISHKHIRIPLKKCEAHYRGELQMCARKNSETLDRVARPPIARAEFLL